MTLITIYALFADDLRLLSVDPKYDDIFYASGLFGLIVFTIEIILASYAKEEYLNSFFFWLDIISTVSMVTDIGWIWILLFSGSTSLHGSTPYDIAKTGRAGRIIRIIRIIRLIRLIRIVKLYK
jgi:hypothetical protein